MMTAPRARLTPEQIADLAQQVDARFASDDDWQAKLILELQRTRPFRMARILADLAWLRKQARKRGHKWAGDQ